MLHIVGSLATAYAYWLSTAREPEVSWLGLEMAARFRADLGREAQLRAEEVLTDPDEESAIQAALQWPARASYLLQCQRAGLTTLLRLWPEAGSLVEELEKRAESAVEAESARLRELIQERARGMPEAEDIAPLPSEEKAASMVVRRCYPGPLGLRGHLQKLSERDREALWRLQQEHGAFIRTPLTLALYWCDGKRTLLEVADLVEQECGQRDMETLVGYFQLLEKMELIEIQ